MRTQLGVKIGEGKWRVVYTHKYRDDLVVKVLKELMPDGRNQNRIEMENWRRATYEMREWLMPCERISRDGKYLFQRKGIQTIAIPSAEIPPFIRKQRDRNTEREDSASGNWVYDSDKKLKLCDYGLKRW